MVLSSYFFLSQALYVAYIFYEHIACIAPCPPEKLSVRTRIGDKCEFDYVANEYVRWLKEQLESNNWKVPTTRQRILLEPGGIEYADDLSLDPLWGLELSNLIVEVMLQDGVTSNAYTNKLIPTPDVLLLVNQLTSFYVESRLLTEHSQTKYCTDKSNLLGKLAERILKNIVLKLGLTTDKNMLGELCRQLFYSGFMHKDFFNKWQLFTKFRNDQVHDAKDIKNLSQLVFYKEFIERLNFLFQSTIIMVRVRLLTRTSSMGIRYTPIDVPMV